MTTTTIRVLNNYIAGRWTAARAATEQLDVTNPATGEVLARVPLSGAADLDAAVHAARTALPEWRAVSTIADRIACLNLTLHYHDVPEHISADLLYRMFACDLQAMGIGSEHQGCVDPGCNHGKDLSRRDAETRRRELPQMKTD